MPPNGGGSGARNAWHGCKAVGAVMRVGVVGAGMIAHPYLRTITRAPELELVAIGSPTMRSASDMAARYGCAARSLDMLYAAEDIDCILNLGPPAARLEVGRAALRAGKHLYVEKPFATSLADAEELMALADANGLMIGSAPDTFMGLAHQMVADILRQGEIGEVVGGAVCFATAGVESWHPNPATFYAPGAGPLLDMGPYYLTALVGWLGPVAEVVALASTTHTRRQITAPQRAGEWIDVTEPTTLNGALLFESGANIAITMSWDVPQRHRPPIELYGKNGSLQAADPNGFGGTVRVSRADGGWDERGAAPPPPLPPATMTALLRTLAAGFDPTTGAPMGPDSRFNPTDQRGIGLVDMARARAEGRMPRASAALAYHVLETLIELKRAAATGMRVEIRSRIPCI